MAVAKAILIFGGAELQHSIITECNKLGLISVVIDPDEHALCKSIATHFVVVGGNDFDETCRVVEKYNIQAIITAATDKPLAMMARVAAKYNFAFYSEHTAAISTDKFLMKEAFLKNHVPCAKGVISNNIPSDINFPVIIKPRDNSGSRGVIYCANAEDAENALKEALSYSKKETVLIEEVILGKEYSIESLHFQGNTKVIQITEKLTTPFPYNVELGHIQPAGLNAETEKKIAQIIELVATSMNFENCASHTELKINDQGIFIIETSPRLGGDFITSTLVPLSTGISMEHLLIKIALKEQITIEKSEAKASAICYFDFKERQVPEKEFMESIFNNASVQQHLLSIPYGSNTPKITNSINRYGYIILSKNTRSEVLHFLNELHIRLEKYYQSKIIAKEADYDIIYPNDEKWDTCLRNTIAAGQIHYSAAYHHMLEKNGDGQAMALYLQDGSSEFFYPFMLNKIQSIGDYQMSQEHSYIKSVYGYTGPVFTNISDSFTIKIKDALQHFFAKENVLFEFVRFNAFINNAAIYNQNFGVDVKAEKKYVYVNLSSSYAQIHSLYSKSFKNNINKAKRNNLHCNSTINNDIWTQFCTLYTSHMKNKNADEYYSFGATYFSLLRELVEKNGKLFYVEIDGILIAATLFISNGTDIYSHHSTRKVEHPLSSIANKLIHDDAIKYFKLNKYKRLLLGGGISSNEQDSLLDFKLSLSKDTLPFYLGKKVIDSDNYSRYLAIWQNTYPELEHLYKNYIEKITKTANNI